MDDIITYLCWTLTTESFDLKPEQFEIIDSDFGQPYIWISMPFSVEAVVIADHLGKMGAHFEMIRGYDGEDPDMTKLPDVVDFQIFGINEELFGKFRPGMKQIRQRMDDQSKNKKH